MIVRPTPRIVLIGRVVGQSPCSLLIDLGKDLFGGKTSTVKPDPPPQPIGGNGPYKARGKTFFTAFLITDIHFASLRQKINTSYSTWPPPWFTAVLTQYSRGNIG